MTMTRTMRGLVLAVVIAGSAAITAPAPRAHGVKDVPAVNPQRYPNSLAYLYQGDVATVLWMQNSVPVISLAALERQLRRGMAHGLSGEVVASTMQHVTPLFTPYPTLPELAQHAVQSARLLAQYTSVVRDYGQALSDALGQYDGAAGRHQAKAAAARVEAAFGGLGAARPGGPLPAALPPGRPRAVQPGQYFADAVLDGRRAYMQGRARALQQAIQARDAAAYGSAFPDVFYAQLDSDLRDSAREALAMSHTDAVLTGQPLDAVITWHVLQAPQPGEAFSMEQLRLINQINLLAPVAAAAPRPLVAALLLLAEDYRRGEQDPALTCAALWAHVHDLDWLVAHYVRVRADGSTAQDALTLIDRILASITAH
jgi:hypothetical protein